MSELASVLGLRDDPFAREQVTDYLGFVRAQPDYAEPTKAMIVAFNNTQDKQKTERHKTDRTARDIMIELGGLRWNVFRSALRGKSVLDIGCGEGVFTEQIAGIPGTEVVAVDHDPEVLDRVPRRDNLRLVEGSGFDLQSILPNEEFDIVFSIYSSLAWSRNAKSAQMAINSALRATRIGGVAIFVPILQHPQSNRLYVEAFKRNEMPGYSRSYVKDSEFESVKGQFAAAAWKHGHILGAFAERESDGQIICAYRASTTNADRTQIHPILPPAHYHEGFSVAATVTSR